MNIPDEPDNTCPLIDEVLKSVEACDTAFDALNGVDFREMKNTMEEIRKANADLRERAQHYEQQAGAFEEERDAAVERAEKAEAELNGLTAALVRQVALVNELEARLRVPA